MLTDAATYARLTTYTREAARKWLNEWEIRHPGEPLKLPRKGRALLLVPAYPWPTWRITCTGTDTFTIAVED